MKISQTGLDFIKSFESFVPYVYDDKVPAKKGVYREWKRGDQIKGTLTIGYGHTDDAKYKLPFKLADVPSGFRLTEAQANEILDVDLDECEEDVNRLVKVPLAQNQFDPCVSLVFNIGAPTFQQSSILRKLNKRDYVGARNAFDLYVNSRGANGKLEYMRGLQRRRDGEQAMWDETPVSLPTEPVFHTAEVVAEKEPMRVGPLGVTVAGSGAVGAVEGAQAAASAIPAPPQQLMDAFDKAGAWKGMSESAVMFGSFAWEKPFTVAVIVGAVLFLTFGLKYLPESWRPA